MDTSTVIEGTVKFRDGKKWKSRWCVMRKLSPVADCLHLQLYRDSKERYKQGHTKASLSLQHFLAIESGFTLDKESNTIAIICQDVTVILAFDTRERLIQWQVKISNNLGEGVQYLIQITSAPPKAKIASGPARLHVQDQRFCMTSGVPPRLLGFWEIGQLRRYGVVEGRFVFEGGSRCGKGEGVHVCVTDQGEEITKTFELAAQGKVASRRRPVARNMSMIDSPRRQTLSRSSDVSCGLQSVMSQHQHLPGESCVDGTVCSCRQHRDGSSPYWLSIESSAAHSSDLDSNYGCGDTVSVSEHFALHDLSGAGLERCVSCISKLGAASMSRSSTATPMTPSSAWAVPLAATPDCGHGYRSNAGSSVSSHGSDGAWYDRPRVSTPPPQVPPKSPKMSPSRIAETAKCQCCPPSRPPKPAQILHKVPETESPTTKKLRKPPLPLPLLRHGSSCQQVACKCPEQRHTLMSTLVKTPDGTLHLCPYDNYDIPKPILGNTYMKDTREDLPNVPDVSDGYYDTPKSIRECLSSTPCYPLPYGNYDVPLSARHLQKTCSCLLKYPKNPGSITSPVDKVIDKHESTPKSTPNNCPCQRVMCWAENWMMLPYCKRGSGIENTGVPIPKVKLSGEGKMPVMNANGDIAIYNTVDCMKHVNRNPSVCKQLTYDNVPVDRECSEPTRTNQNDESITCAINDTSKSNIRNYANMTFSESLEYYENSKDVITRAGIHIPSVSELMMETQCNVEAGDSDHELVNVCNKCGHACRVPSDVKITLRKADATENLVTTLQEDYLFMEPRNTPVSQSCAEPSINTIGEGSRTLHSYIASSDKCAAITGRSVSIPSLDTSLSSQSLADHLRSHTMVRCKSENNKYSRSSRPSADELRKQHFLLRKRSSSADSSRFLDEVDEVDNSLEEPCGLPQAGSCDSVLHSTATLTENPDLCVKEVISPDLQESVLSVAECTKIPDVAQVDPRSSEEVAMTDREDDTAVEDESSTNESLSTPVPKSEPAIPGVVACMRRSSSVPSKSANNRDSSSSNDSGVSVGSLKHRGGDFAEFELPLTTSLSSKRHHHVIQRHTTGCLHSSLPRRSKSVDPLRDISFQFKEIESQVKCSSAEAEVPVCPKRRGFQSPSGDSAIVVPYPDSRSTSSGTSDMSDYIETLSLSSHSSSDVQESLRLGKLAVTTLKPRSGNEYQLIDRSVLEGGGKVK